RLGRDTQFYRPIVGLYFFLGRHIWGCDPFVFHFVSVLIHLLNTAVLYKFARSLVKGRTFAALTALLFAVQPGYVQAVVWVSAVTEQLVALWYLLTLWSFLSFLEGRGRVFLGLALATFSLGLLTHESSAPLLVLMIALDATMATRRGDRAYTRLVRHLPTY